MEFTHSGRRSSSFLARKPSFYSFRQELICYELVLLLKYAFPCIVFLSFVSRRIFRGFFQLSMKVAIAKGHLYSRFVHNHRPSYV